jgi:hypothetical protein
MFSPEVRQPRQQPAHGERADRAHGQHFAIMSVGKAFKNLRDVIKRSAQDRQQRFALAGQHQPTGQAFEQGYVELRLKAFDLMADGGLGHTQLHRRAGKAQMARRSFECAQCVQRQLRSNHAQSQIFLMAHVRFHRLSIGAGLPKLAALISRPNGKSSAV